MKPLSRSISILVILVAGANLLADGNPAFNKAIVFAQTNSVRVEATLSAAHSLPKVQVTGSIRDAGSGVLLWKGTLKSRAADENTLNVSDVITPSERPRLWSPNSPALYKIEITASAAGRRIASKTVRFGFRSFEIRDGQFHLNGQPVFLRGVAINPPGRGIPDKVGESRKFALDYVRFLKSQNVNIFRISTDESQAWFDACDELGMMLYAGRYGAPMEADPAKKAPPEDFDKSITAYKKLFEGYASHPSIVEYYLSNELPHSGERGAAFSDYLNRACAELKKWDDTRPYIGNAGYGEGREGDVCDVHRYWGWYYNSFLTYYNLRDKLFEKPLFGDAEKNQPLTFTECVGSFTGSSGEFNVVRSKQLAPSLGWIGHTETPREDALLYQSFMTRQACELFRRMRPQNPRLAGLMPFTILFYNWSGISSFRDMKPKPVMEGMRLAYQPILLSWELWTPQVYAGTEIRPIAHVINDDDEKRDLENAVLEFRIRDRSGKEHVGGQLSLPTVRYYDTWRKSIALKIPKDVPTGHYLLTGTIRAGAKLISTNFAELFIAGNGWKNFSTPGKTIHLFDPAGKTAAALQKLGVRAQSLEEFTALPKKSVVVIGEEAWDKSLSAKSADIRRFVREGGRIFCLRVNPAAFDPSWLPQKISFFTSSANDPDYPPRSRPFREQMNVNPLRPGHPVFAGLHHRNFSMWSDYSDWNQTQPGFPKIYPVAAGFRLVEPKALAQTAVLADYDRGLEGVALCEMFDGDGSVILSAFDLVNRIGLDPAADRLLANLLRYVASDSRHEIHPLIEKPVRWGNYPSEQGLMSGSLNGLLVHAEWIRSPANRKAEPLPPNTGAWNMLPGEQFSPRGRNPFGVYGYSTAASLKDGNPESKTGEGFFWARVPAGKKWVVTVAKNPEKTPGTLHVFVNGQRETTSSARKILPGKTVRITTAMPDAETVCVRYAGEKTLVLVETSFK